MKAEVSFPMLSSPVQQQPRQQSAAFHVNQLFLFFSFCSFAFTLHCTDFYIWKGKVDQAAAELTFEKNACCNLAVNTFTSGTDCCRLLVMVLLLVVAGSDC